MSHFTVLVIGDNPEKQLIPFQENNMGDCPKEYLVFEEDEDCEFDEEMQKNGYWENPNAKWDWYQLGGRWTGRLKLKSKGRGEVGKPGLLTDKAKKGFVDSARKKHIETSELKPTFAVLKDGIWYERGQMGWFAMVSNEKNESQWENEFSKLINDLSDETLLSIYDCHI